MINPLSWAEWTRKLYGFFEALSLVMQNFARALYNVSINIGDTIIILKEILNKIVKAVW